jgi:riboflavin kinase/FMN adenylyltransferase
MIIIQQLNALQPYPRPVLTLGNFDGLHLGHREILKRVVERASHLEGTSMVFTFQFHPLELLAPHRRPPALNTLDEKTELFRQLGIQVLICVPFTIKLANQTAENFLEQIIYKTIQPVEIIVGHDYAFGHRRSGTVHLLQQMQSQYGYKVEVVEAVQYAGVTPSSSLVRQMIEQGQIQEANQLLGRIYSMSATVVSGTRKGKELGYPTATLSEQSKLMPAVGVYAVWVALKGQQLMGVANIGCQPTYGKFPQQLEVHILDFKGDIYGKQLRIGFVARIREEIAFSGEEELKAQIEKDVKHAQQILTKSPPPDML